MAEAFGAATGQPVRCIAEPQPGKSHALNTGLAAVRTELVITLDADTLLHPPGRPPAGRPAAQRPTRRAGRGRVGAGPQQPRQPLDPHAGMGLLPRDRVGEADARPVPGHPGRTGRLQPLPHPGGAAGRRLARRHRRGHRPDLAAHAQRGPGHGRGLRSVKPWSQPRWLLRFLTAIDLLIPALDVAYALVWLPGLLLVATGRYWIVGPYALAVLPLTLVVNLLLYRFQRRKVFNQLGLRIRRNAMGFVGFVLAYQLLMSPVAVIGYAPELLGLRRRWK